MDRIDSRISLMLLMAATVLGLAYLVRIRIKGRASFDRVDRQGGSPLLSKSIMEMGYWSLQPFCRALIRMGVEANALSYAALVFGGICGYFFARGHFGIAALMGLVGGMLDALDGMVARAVGTMSYSGKVLDSTLDRYVEFFMFGGLVLYFEHQIIFQAFVLVAMLGSFMVSYSTALSEITQIQLPRGVMQRSERMVYLILGAALTPLTHGSVSSDSLWIQASSESLPILCSLILIGWMANLSAILRMRYIRRSIREREQRAIALTLAQVRNIRPSTRSQTR